MHKIILKFFDVIRSLLHFLKMVCVFLIIILSFFWVQNILQAEWKWLAWFTPFLTNLVDFANDICSLSFNIWGAIIELKYISAILILLVFYLCLKLLNFFTGIVEAGYKSTHFIYKKTKEIALNKELKENITREEKSINKYVVVINTKIKPKYTHKDINIDLGEQNELMIDFIKQKLSLEPVVSEEGFMYTFKDYSRIDKVLEVLFKVLKSSAPIDYAICIQVGNNMQQLRKLISLEHYGKITMAADTSYRYRYNDFHRYQTSQIGIFQYGDKTIEVHEFREFS